MQNDKTSIKHLSVKKIEDFLIWEKEKKIN